ncbi:MAG: hypothetical protein CMO01_30230, partial [Thalassobius sp.]|nr:hypothetical protein [Thalassovita sp.]
MKKYVIIIAIGLSFLTSCDNEEVEIDVLSNQEISDLLFLREEEKLARDVYMYSFNKYSQSIFTNISNSEQSHMNSVLSLLDKYGLTDPVTNNEAGVFANEELQELYNQLTDLSDTSLSKALEVGANIEDLDIKDIETFM